MNHPGFTIARAAAIDINPYLILKPAASGTVTVAAAATDKLLGTSRDVLTPAGQACDIVMGDAAEVMYGGTVADGDPLTSDANGKAITAAPATGANVRIIGYALAAGVSGDIGTYRYAPGFMQG